MGLLRKDPRFSHRKRDIEKNTPVGVLSNNPAYGIIWYNRDTMATKATKECPHCGAKVYWLKELKEWNEIYGDDWKSQAMISVMCRKCGKYAFGVDIYEITKTETVKSPIGDVKIPKV